MKSSLSPAMLSGADALTLPLPSHPIPAPAKQLEAVQAHGLAQNAWSRPSALAKLEGQLFAATALGLLCAQIALLLS